MAKHRTIRLATAFLLTGLGIIGLSGCQSCHVLSSTNSGHSRQLQSLEHSASQPDWAQILAVELLLEAGEVAWPSQGSDQELAEQFLELADSLSAANDSRSPDYFFQAALYSWQAINNTSSEHGSLQDDWCTYQASLLGLVTESVRFGRIARGQMRIYRPSGMQEVDVIENGLPWPSEELSELRIASAPKHHKLKQYYSQTGIGVPVIATRTSANSAREDPIEGFFRPRLPVAATALLRPRPSLGQHGINQVCDEFVLELVNPLNTKSIRVGQQKVEIASDISAPLEEILQANSSNWLTGFILPASQTTDGGLKWLEPYQPGKIPIVFIHGLASDPTTWFDMVNYLRTQDWFNQRYQVWGFSYATGSPFVTSAFRLRSQMRRALNMIDPLSQDTALSQMVLVGHSMGGLVAKLQITESGDAIWNSISHVPLDSIRASKEVKQQLAERLYFAPQPYVNRVIYIATPHAGSSLAVRGIGRLSSALVRPDEVNRANHRKLIDDNPDAFLGTFQRRIPTSIDLLDPNDATLQTIYELPVPDRIAQHNVVGTGNWLWTWGQSDGVVTIDSAYHPSTVSESHIANKHTEITKDEATISEVARILKLHLD